jgi:hypothetical protein
LDTTLELRGRLGRLTLFFSRFTSGCGGVLRSDRFCF